MTTLDITPDPESLVVDTALAGLWTCTPRSMHLASMNLHSRKGSLQHVSRLDAVKEHVIKTARDRLA